MTKPQNLAAFSPSLYLQDRLSTELQRLQVKNMPGEHLDLSVGYDPCKFYRSRRFQRGSQEDYTLFVLRSTLLEAFRFHGKTLLVTHLNLHFTSSNNSNYVLELVLTFKS